MHFRLSTKHYNQSSMKNTALLISEHLFFTYFGHLYFRELRSKIPSQILLNFCIALSLSLIIFLAAAERSRTSLIGCRAGAIALHYFLLATFLWMAVEALNMYHAFVKVFPQSTPSKFMVKCSMFAWGKY